MWRPEGRSLTIAHQRSHRLVRSRGRRIGCVEGVVWVTLDRDERDIVLDGGESFVVDCDAPVLIFALRGPAVVDIAGAGRHG
jgi:hypothetical protein